MEAIANPYTKILARKYMNATSTTSIFIVGRSEIRFLRSSHSKTHYYQSVSSSHRSSQKERFQEARNDHQIHQILFMLNSSCKRSVGLVSNFFVVGNDPAIGLWIPTRAIPLNWSEGDIWSVELDIPAGLQIEFKFILRQSSGKILWQPGPNRIFQTSETKNSIVIFVDWKNSRDHDSTEKQIVGHNGEETISPDIELHVNKKGTIFSDYIADNSNGESISRKRITNQARKFQLSSEKESDTAHSVDRKAPASTQF
ncbi:Phosphoglucan, water dikinase, chloroplastic [Quillaja saponaria]|uniref:Phosphoglucan, water dikinase, chloroplastic n=1 Tax=Quillaja saponaria TaxID=32244 RepID=A0AAD7LTV6_QUISA|nr:Phosphoglucan, water dikinase, chloroplastic [Quillaja saponaria]KAJ7964163.1 Phosphoglucan, water dikinase, chloroplastic [Quillaja saponaria]